PGRGHLDDLRPTTPAARCRRRANREPAVPQAREAVVRDQEPWAGRGSRTTVRGRGQIFWGSGPNPSDLGIDRKGLPNKGGPADTRRGRVHVPRLESLPVRKDKMFRAMPSATPEAVNNDTAGLASRESYRLPCRREPTGDSHRDAPRCFEGA